ncbi:hypothetical protein EHEL_030040 [Encephalitozoon hellem ATCC 50504]|uniref:Uncharacterized protein n=1 Tax=Encephalitozoon hellem TaxID=27973 RepID=A0A9Q9C3A4_ENCHE|nr:uncharacterized protein EHEL_030040 [Encephalitozoon hellem ATCC 50504]AFM97903.1 hypothetical protein EHEL_030040 [Encephalitozoon hellem ATCC 50504]UTX42705.1 hypothetical protein GPU96_03g04250 [Encephalitozoon hellem]WEL38164.1 hypothetical protein PFJ87_03g00200 [Encephalitozoon hellem]|eukprot:XP_003886884.1 hypothetical protein EHEL_030040 [Encephalitozoon hellem ATCC 50504]
MNRYETADHDYMHAKDYFNNYKFGYIERTTKTLLLQSLRPEDRQGEDLLTILNQSKSQLKDVKSIGQEASRSISELSELIYDAKNKLLKYEEMLKYEIEREKSSKEECARLESLDENLRIYDELVSQFDRGCKEMQENAEKINALKKEIEMLSTSEAEEELKSIKSRRDKLSGRKKRLSLITMESYIEDSYNWYRKALEFIRNVFGIDLVTVEQENNEMYMRLKVFTCEVGIFVRDGRMIESKLYGTSNEDLALLFPSLSKLAISINDPRILLMLVADKCRPSKD